MTATLDMIQNNEVPLIGFRELARRLEVSRTAPYRHFESVEALLAVIAEEGFRKFVEVLKPLTEDKALTPRERFLELEMAYINFALDNPAHYRLMFDQRFFQGGAFETVEQLAKKAFDLLRKTAADCLDNESSKEDIYQVANLAWASVHGISKLIMDGQWNHIRDRQAFLRKSCEKLLGIL